MIGPMPIVRENARYACSVAVRVNCPTWENYLDLHATNISHGGVFVASDILAKIGTEVTVELKLPTGAVVALEAQVVHHKGDVSGMGLMFTEMDKETRAALDAMVTVAKFTVQQSGAAKPPPTTLQEIPSQEPPKPTPREPIFAEVIEQTLLNELARRIDLGPREQLGLEADASGDEIDLAYFRLCEKYHPVIFEKYPEGTKELVRQLNALVQKAYEALTPQGDLKEIPEPPKR